MSEIRFAAIEERLHQLEIGREKPASGGGPQPADDYALDGQYGDPVIKKDPPRWKGESFVGQPMSQTSPEYLRNLAGFQMWKAGKDDEAVKTLTGEEKEKKIKYAGYARKDAGLALGWALRIEKRAKSGVGGGDGERFETTADPDIPFIRDATFLRWDRA